MEEAGWWKVAQVGEAGPWGGRKDGGGDSVILKAGHCTYCSTQDLPGGKRCWVDVDASSPLGCSQERNQGVPQKWFAPILQALLEGLLLSKVSPNHPAPNTNIPDPVTHSALFFSLALVTC